MLRNQSKKLFKSIQQKYLSKINHCKQKNLHCHKKFIQRAYTTQLKKDTKLFNFYTDLPNHSIFLWVYSLVSERKLFLCLKLASKEEHLLLVLMKLKQEFFNADLAFRFSILHSDVSRIYNSWIVELSNVLKFLIIWPEHDALRKKFAKLFFKIQKLH